MHDDTAITDTQLKHFGLIMAGMLCAMFGIVLPWLFGFDYPRWPWLLATPFLVLAILKPAWLHHPYRAWMTLGHGLGWINSRIILGSVFFIIITPIGLLMRTVFYDPMLRRLDNTQNSYRKTTQARQPQHVERPF